MNNRYAIYNDNRDSKIGIELLDRNNVSWRDMSSTGLFFEINFSKKNRDAFCYCLWDLFIED